MSESSMPELPKAYEPHDVERKWYKYWLERGYFTPHRDPAKVPFVIIQPPPNITGDLHLGHALTATIEDIMTRWHRMRGEPTLWLPGEDHAGIAAQVVVERLLAKEGLTRHQIGREAFLARVWQWVGETRDNIANQHRRLGVSCDWTRERFTLDAGPSRAVRTAFVRLYNKGLIYRGERIINWCPRCATALSDLEVEHQNVPSNLWHIKYPVVGEDGYYVIVATTRPETMLGDTAVAVNPSDERYGGIIGKSLMLPIVGSVIPVVADEAVAVDFGTGAVKVTPAHDPTDFEIGLRHKLPIINILNPDGTIGESGGKYQGQERFAARQAIVAELEQMGLLERIEPHTHAVGHCQRCRTVVEPMASLQWFVKIAPLAAPAISAVKDGRIRIVPERFTKVYLNWMENIRDWCISRQLWWGHRIPVWYCACGEMVVAVDDPKICPRCGGSELCQDPDVLDTWFSSGLWPHSTLGWPDDTEDLRYFYPTTIMETAYDILFFWVARMIMMGIEDTGEIPFRFVYLHGLIRDERGEKMSKTKGNVLDPLVLMDRYGTDALRFAVLWGTSPGNDSKLGDTKLEAGRNFANKLYNAARFVLRYATQDRGQRLEKVALTLEDRWILSRLARVNTSVTALMEEFEFGEALRQMHDFLWGEFCDWYIELTKGRLQSGAEPSPLPVLVHVLEQSLRLLHPYMPFVTEELWQSLKTATGQQSMADSIMISHYPVADESLHDDDAERVMDGLVEIVRAVRNTRAEYDVASERMIEIQIYAGVMTDSFQPYVAAIESLAKAKVAVLATHRRETSSRALALVLKAAEVVIPMASLFDLAAETARLEKEIAEAMWEQARLEAHLGDETFLARAPEAVVVKEKERLAMAMDKQARLKEHLQRLGE
ncbi:MAG: valine--tRNA ligase [Dehalococcoidia bacterium]|nr:valine--tRNA ligase [Dehalococcoidia bacterium]